MFRNANSRNSDYKTRTSSMIEEALINVGTKQLLFYEDHVCTINRITLLPGEQFSETAAIRLLNKHYHKRQAHCKARLLEDRLSLEREKLSSKIPFRSWVSYAEIKDIYVLPNKPEYFILAIKSELNGNRYFEIYKTKASEKTKSIESFIKRAMNDPNKRLHGSDNLRQVSLVDTGRVRSVANFEMEHPRDSVSYLHASNDAITEMTSPRPPDGFPSYLSNQNTSPIPSMDYRTPSPQLIKPVRTIPANGSQVHIAAPKQVEYVQASAPTRESPVYIIPNKRVENVYNERPVSIAPKSSAEYVVYNVDGSDEYTYMNYEHKKGLVINDNGPVYLFASRTLSQPDLSTFGDSQKNIYGSNSNYRYSNYGNGN